MVLCTEKLLFNKKLSKLVRKVSNCGKDLEFVYNII